MGKVTAENVLDFMQDMQALKDAGEDKAVTQMATQLKNSFKGYGKSFTNQILEQAAAVVTETDPSQRIKALNKLGYLTEDPGRQFKTVPDEGHLKTAGKALLGGALEPIAGPQGKQAFRDWKAEEGSHYPAATATGSFLGNMVPELALSTAYSKVPGLKNLRPGAQAPVVATASGATMGAANEESSVLQGALGGLSGSVVGQAARNRFLPGRSSQPQFTQDLIIKQQNKGYNALPGFQSGRRSAEQVDMALKKNTSTADDIQER